MVMAVKFDLKKEYFNYLVRFVCNNVHHKVDYLPLLDTLHSIKFVAVLDRDVNRIADGADLRKVFLSDADIDDSYIYEFDDMDVSVLEVLVGIAKRIEFQVGNTMEKDRTAEKFWVLVQNLDIEKYDSGNYKPLNIREKVQKWMERRFEKNGKGSIFPLSDAKTDQRKEEIWTQMSNYIWENWFEEE